MILLCHIIHYYPFIPGSSFMGNVLDSAVYTFLGISGYLYGEMTIDSFRCWFKKRIAVILIPAILFSVFVLLIRIIIGESTDVLTFMLYALNLRGLTFIFPMKFLSFQEIPVLGPLWFIAVIMVCYCLVPLLQVIRNKGKSISLISYITAGIIAFASSYFLSVNLSYILVFAFCYFLSCGNKAKNIKPSMYAIFSAVTVLFQIGRIIMRAYFDGQNLYSAYVSVSHAILGVWILVTFLFVFQYVKNIHPRMIRVVAWLDGISLYVYIVHGCFFRGRLNAYELTDSLLLATFLFFGLSIASAIVLRYVSSFIQKQIFKL